MTNFVRGANPIWFFSNLVGQPFDDTYYAFFLTNTLPYVPQAVFEDPDGMIAWSNPIEFQPSSGLPNNIYFDDNLVYRIEFRQGPTQNDPLIYLVENYMPADNSGTSDLIANADNMITNPQFADIYFSSPVTYTVAGTYHLAPGWDLVLTGAGSTTVTQGKLSGQDSATEEITGAPSYYLQFNNSGWTTVQLIQKFSNNGAIYNNGTVAAFLQAFSTTSPTSIAVNYSPSTGSSQVLIPSTVVGVGNLQPFAGGLNLQASTNTDEGSNAYVNIVITLPNTGIISLTNVQITGQSTAIGTAGDVVAEADLPIYQEITYERMVDQEFHVYKNSLVREPKSTILTGWNFGLNPWQFTSTSLTNVSGTSYTADQTIVIQQAYVASATDHNVATLQASLANDYGFQVTAVTAHNNFAILQYIDPATIRPYWGKTLSSLVRGLFTTAHSTAGVQFKMMLIYKAGLPGTLSQTEPVASWPEFGTPVLQSGWTAIKPQNDPTYTLGSGDQEFPFEGFVLPASTNSNMTLGILLYTITNMNQNATADFVVFKDISLVENDFAIASNPETFDQVLAKCQYYYEKSYENGTLPVGPTYPVYNNCYFAPQLVFNENGAANDRARPESFEILYNTIKRTNAPLLTFYSAEVGTVATVSVYVQHGNVSVTGEALVATYWTGTSVSSKRALYNQISSGLLKDSTAALAPSAYLLFHYLIDARLGLVV